MENTMLCRRSYVGGLLLVGSLVAARPATAAQIGFNLTEVNSTTLTSSLAGVVITNTAADTWTVDVGAAGIALTGTVGILGGAWAEPDSATTVNYLHPVAGTATLVLQSDFPIGQLPANVFCGLAGPIPLGVTCGLGTDANANGYFVAVLDRADAPAAVPEPASMLLLGTGLIGMGARRWRNRRQRG